jgi:hypothetical protein
MFIINNMPEFSLSRYRNKKTIKVKEIKSDTTIKTLAFLKSFSLLFLMSNCLNPTRSIYIHRKYPPTDAKKTKKNPNGIKESETSLAQRININTDKAIMPKYISRYFDGFICSSLSI